MDIKFILAHVTMYVTQYTSKQQLPTVEIIIQLHFVEYK